MTANPVFRIRFCLLGADFYDRLLGTYIFITYLIKKKNFIRISRSVTTKIKFIFIISFLSYIICTVYTFSPSIGIRIENFRIPGPDPYNNSCVSAPLISFYDFIKILSVNKK